MAKTETQETQPPSGPPITHPDTQLKPRIPQLGRSLDHGQKRKETEASLRDASSPYAAAGYVRNASEVLMDMLTIIAYSFSISFYLRAVYPTLCYFAKRTIRSSIRFGTTTIVAYRKDGGDTFFIEESISWTSLSVFDKGRIVAAETESSRSGMDVVLIRDSPH
ncbi:hypothetical protein C1H46_008407 [Malus baccata]|uniref:Uncharacterized protein n=1 Tax=Malus baccata TaxID=106549 RepID=A0A540N601_MALBA|nr:hypothetical protein C1H46_008407 [Malus baccata]